MKKLFYLFLSIPIVFAACEDEDYRSIVPMYSDLIVEHVNPDKIGQPFRVGDTLVATAIESSRGKWIDRVNIKWKAEKATCLPNILGEYVYGEYDAPYNLTDTIVLNAAGVATVTMKGLFRSMANMRQYNQSTTSTDNTFKATYETESTKLFYYDVTLEKKFNVAF